MLAAVSTCAGALDWQPWLALSSLEHLHLHINPAWRAPLQPAAIAAMAAAWPKLTHLHLRLSPSDNATHALEQLAQFKQLKSLSLTWLGQAAPAGAGHAAHRGRRSSSLESAAFNMAYLPAGLEVGSAAVQVAFWIVCLEEYAGCAVLGLPAVFCLQSASQRFSEDLQQLLHAGNHHRS